MKKILLALLLVSFFVGLAPHAFASETATTSKGWELPIFKKKKSAKLSRAAASKKRNPVSKKKIQGSKKSRRTW